MPWPRIPLDLQHFQLPPREYGILPFWFLNGELNPEEMRYQIREFFEKGMPGIILHGRYGLEIPYITPTYLDRIRFAVEEAEKLGLKTWIYDEMNWPSGTADKRVLQARPDLAQRYIECINFTVRGPWFTYLTGADSRYLDFEHSTPVAAFAIRLDGGDRQVVDLTPNLSFVNVIPWEAPAGNWRLVYIVEKEADYYIDALNPESTKEFLRLGYEPYAQAVERWMASQMLGFYTDEPAMHYFLSGADNAVVPWTKDMFRRFQERNGYNLRPRLPDLFFDLSPESARVRYDFYNTLTDFYSQAFYQQIHTWCQAHNVLFTGHLLYEEGVRGMIRVEGNLFRHYQHMDVVGVDHLYPIIGTRDRPSEHVAMKVASSAAHQLGSPRLLCESFGGIFMDATMQRMKWIADWEYVLGVNLLNPHGFHYTLEGPRKRDWPPSMFYQYPWWRYYGEFSNYISRLSHLLSGGRHIAKVAVLWPINAMFAVYIPQHRTPMGERLENDTYALTDLLLRLHYDFDYLDEDLLASAELVGSSLRVHDEAYELLILPPITHLKLDTVERLEQYVAQGGKVLGMVFLPDRAFSQDSLVDISDRMQTLFGVNPAETQQNYRQAQEIELIERASPSGGKAGFLRSYALARHLPMRLQWELGTPGQPESPLLVVETGSSEVSRYYFAQADRERQEITGEVNQERQAMADAMRAVLNSLVTPDVTIDHPDVFYLHRINDDQDIYFFVNPTFNGISARVSIAGEVQPVRWDPSTGKEHPIVPFQAIDGRTHFQIDLSQVGSAFVLTRPGGGIQILETNLRFDSLDPGAGGGRITGYGPTSEGFIVLEQGGKRIRKTARGKIPSEPILLGGEWEFQAEAANALVIGNWLATQEEPGRDRKLYTSPLAEPAAGWLPMVPGAWTYQLPAEPDLPYPTPVWYQIRFLADYLPPHVDLIVDGFAGSDWELHINGQPVTSAPVRSAFDSQMKAVDITLHLQRGDNLIALRLVVTKSTDGLLDLLKITGDFSLDLLGDGRYQISAPRSTLQPQSWTEQGYPFYSGLAVYSRRFQLPEAFLSQRVFLQAELQDDALEVLVNGQPAGIRLWPGYDIEVTQLLKPGENLLELRVANTLVNLLEAVQRPSGLCGAPRLVGYQQFTFDL
ncbi:MAG TPA: glycosyl hydrolase [Anaerolineales bacterium]|nr:glycosyl hydrolase [Anaerolineales bacterium]